MELKIIVDSSCGIENEEAKKLNIDILPLNFSFNGQNYKDGIDITKDEFYKKLTTEKVFPKTSLPNLYETEELINKRTEEGYKIIIITLSSKISGTFNTLTSLFSEQKNIKVIDSLSTVCGLRFLIDEAYKNKDKSLDEIEKALNSLKGKIRILAGVSTLEYLYRGGRLSRFASIAGNIIGLKPIIGIVDGKVELISKKHGKKHVIEYLIKKLNLDEVDLSYPIYGVYSMNKDNYLDFYNKITTNEIKDNIKQVDNIAAVIGCHIGPDAFGACYIAK